MKNAAPTRSKRVLVLGLLWWTLFVVPLLLHFAVVDVGPETALVLFPFGSMILWLHASLIVSIVSLIITVTDSSTRFRTDSGAPSAKAGSVLIHGLSLVFAIGILGSWIIYGVD